MKKMLKVLTGLLAVCLLSVGIVGTVFALDSTGPVTYMEIPNGVTIEAVADADWLAAEDAAKVMGVEDSTKVQVLQLMDLTSDKLPLTLTVHTDLEDTVYVLHKGSSGWEIVGQGKGPSFEVTFTSLSPVALVAGPETAATPAADDAAAEEKATSPKTGENFVLLYSACAAILLGGVIAFVAFRKKAE